MEHTSPWMNDELRMFRTTVRTFIQQEFLPYQSRWQQQGHPDLAAWAQAGSAELLITDISENYGGGGGNIAHEAVKMEELAFAGVHFAFAIQSIVAHYILAYGTESQKQNWLPRMAHGELVGAIAMTEAGAGSDLQGIKTTARRDGDFYLINGSKTFITSGWLAGVVVLAVRTDRRANGLKDLSLLVVETRDLPGFRVGRPLHKLGMQSQDTCELFFDDVRVPASNLLGPNEGDGFSQMMAQLPYERLLVAVEAVATAEQAVAITTRYTKDRITFGRPLIDFQNTRFKLAECKTEARVARVFLDHCICNYLNGHFDGTDAAMAKYWLTECETRILDECVQLHGGYGYMTEYAIARMWVDSRVHRVYAGANEIMKEIIGMSL